MKKELTARQERFQGNFNLYVTVVLGLVILLGVNFLAYRHYWRKDLSLNRYYELSPKTSDLLQKLKSPVTITTYLATSQLRGEIESLIREYKFIGGEKVVIENVDPALDLERAETLSKKFKFGAEENLVIFEYLDRSKYVSERELAEYEGGGMMMGAPQRMKAFKGEQQFTAAIQSLVEGKQGKVYFITGHGERSPEDRSQVGYSTLAARIKGENIDSVTWNLAQNGEIPKDADAVVVAGAKTPFLPAEVQVLAAYLEQKGKLIVLQDPQTTSGLEPLLEQYGIQFQNNAVLTVAMALAGSQMRMTGEFMAVAETYAEHPAVRFLQGYNLQMPRARSVAVSQTAPDPVKSKVTLLVKTGKDSWGETNLTERKVQFDQGVDHQGPLGVVALYDGGELPGESVKVAGARVLAVGSSLFLVNQALDSVAVDFFTNSLNWMTKREAAIGIGAKLPQEYRLSLSPLQKRSVFGMACLVMPGLAIVLGFTVWVRRRR